MAVAQNKSQPTQGQVLGVLAADATQLKSAADAILFSSPRIAGNIGAKCYRAVDFRVGEGFFVPLIPSGAEKGTEICWQRLLHIDAKALFQRALAPMESDVGSLIDAILIRRNRLAVVAHVGVVQINQRTNMCLQALKPLWL